MEESGFDRDDLDSLLRYLDTERPGDAVEWRDWFVQPVSGGANNRLYRATAAKQDLAIKFTIDDPRDRAGREHLALSTLHQLDLGIAPEPLYLDRSTLSQPVVVQRWLEGTVDDDPPSTDRDWLALIDHFAAIHSVTPDRSTFELPRAVVTAFTAREAVQLIRDQAARVPEAEGTGDARRLLAKLDDLPLPDWQPVTPVLCRCDPNTRNLIRRRPVWSSVDWENSGWGDPAYEIADLLTHPAYIGVTAARRRWVIDVYCERRSDPALNTRILTYYRCGLLWWVARFKRMLYEVPRGLDSRLVTRPSGWEATTRAKLNHYIERASKMLAAQWIA